MMPELDAWRALSTTVEDAREARERTEQTERLAGLFAQALPQALNYQLGVGEESSDSWQGGVGKLTPDEPLAPMCAETEGAPPSSDTLVFSLRAGDLGEVKFSVNRGENGVRVVIGMDGQNAVNAAGVERAALEAALRATGLTVQSVAVVPLAKFGTPLARRGEAPDARNVRQVHSGFRGSSRGNRRVKLIG
jgi:hypothetical protein